MTSNFGSFSAPNHQPEALSGFITPISRQTLVAALAMPEQVLHHMERVLDLRADARLGVLRLLDELASRVRLVQLLVG